MDKKLKAKWVKALRSGRYDQTTGSLHDDVGYCCLGVLCTLVGAKWKRDDNGDLAPFIDGKNVSREGEFYLGSSLLKKVGITHDRQVNLGRMNDGSTLHAIQQRSFPEIADYIEKNIRAR